MTIFQLLKIDDNWIFESRDCSETLSRHQKLEAGGKASTWCPPRELVGLYTTKNMREHDDSTKTFIIHSFSWILFVIFAFRVKFRVSILNKFLMVIWIYWDRKSISFDVEKLRFLFWIDFEILDFFLFLSCFKIFGDLRFFYSSRRLHV